MADFRLPNDTQRCMNVGRTGSGKSQAGIWQLSLRSYDQMPWVLLDFKRESLIAQIPHSIYMQHSDGSPDYNFPLDKPGIYILQPHPDDVEQVNEFFYRIWQQENVGVYVDEAYMIGGGKGDCPGFRALLTQGRSKHVPMIMCSQRPSRITLFAFTEADFFQVFHLGYLQDRKRVAEYMPYDTDKRLPPYYSTWYDVARDKSVVLQPVPDAGTILATFERRLGAVAPQVSGKPRKIAI